MNLLHFGGYPFISEALADAQRAKGHDVDVFYANAELFNLCFSSTVLGELVNQAEIGKYDILFLHSLDLLCFEPANELEAALKRIKEFNCRLVSLAYRGGAQTQASRLVGLDSLSKAFCMDLTSYRALGELSPLWLPLPLYATDSNEGVTEIPRIGEIKVLHIPYLSDEQENDRIRRVFNELNSKNQRFIPQILQLTELNELENLYERLNDCHIFVDGLRTSSPGPLAFLAMGMGKTVLAANSQEAKNTWNHLSTCPALDTNFESFSKRLDATIREPKCLKDFAKRGKQFVQHYNNPGKVAELLMNNLK